MPDSVKTVHFRWWVFWTGIFNIVAYAALLCPFTLKIFLGTSSGLGNALGVRRNSVIDAGKCKSCYNDQYSRPRRCFSGNFSDHCVAGHRETSVVCLLGRCDKDLYFSFFPLFCFIQ